MLIRYCRCILCLVTGSVLSCELVQFYLPNVLSLTDMIPDAALRSAPRRRKERLQTCSNADAGWEK
jgi:hypothetical protein